MSRMVVVVAAGFVSAVASAFDLRSSAFVDGGMVPAQYTCDGADRSPPLAWKDPPERTTAFALLCEDPDAPSKTWVHWVVYDVPATARELPEGLPPVATLPDGVRQGVNDFKRTGWGGPCPPPGPAHRYFFRLYALDAKPRLGPGATRDELVAAIAGHTLAHAELVGRYARKR